jgi:hypothetical protein
MLLGDIAHNQSSTHLILHSSRRIRRRAWSDRSAPWFALGIRTQILLDVLLRAFPIDFEHSRPAEIFSMSAAPLAGPFRSTTVTFVPIATKVVA